MLTHILTILLGLLFGNLLGRLWGTYEIVRRRQPPTVDQLGILTTQLGAIRTQLNNIWAVLQANGYQTDAYTGFTGATIINDYSGYNFTGYGATAIHATTGPISPMGPIGAIGPQGEPIVLGAAVPSTIPPAAIIPEVDYLEEQRDI